MTNPLTAPHLAPLASATDWEELRQDSLERYALVDSSCGDAEVVPEVDAELQDLAALTQRLLGVEATALNIIDGGRQVTVASSPGMPRGVFGRASSLCAAVLSLSPLPELYLAEDLQRDKLLNGSPFVTGEIASLRHYVSAPLVGREGLPLGTLCAFSSDLIEIDPRKVQLLRHVGDAVMATLDARRRAREVQEALLQAESDGLPWRPDESRIPEVTDSRVAELSEGIAKGQVEVHYQPLVDLATGAVKSVEALVRWLHPTRGLVSPAEFVPLAEKHGLIGRLTDVVLAQVVEQTTSWAARGLDLTCAVNVSPVVLNDAGECAHVLELLSRHRGALTVEVTESALTDDDAMSRLREFAAAGVRVALDDFGTGYSSLSSVKDLPISVLKIDRSFLTRLDQDQRDQAIVAMIVQLAHALDLEVVAEGVETDDVAEQLCLLGISKAQGFRFARPMPGGAIQSWLEARETPISATEDLTPRERPDLVLDGVRTLFRSTDPDEALSVLVSVATELGGHCVPLEHAGPHAIPVDLTLGYASPVLVDAPLGSEERRILESTLPGIVEDARLALAQSVLSGQLETDRSRVRVG